MRLLVTNDDSIDCVFLHVLVHALRAAGHELFVVAPATEQSWTGASKTRTRHVASARVERGFGCPTWTVDGTPSDCVNIALAHLLPRTEGSDFAEIDGVVSGINVGCNISLGFIIASGTVAGAFEGALHGFPAVAFSQDVTPETYDLLKERGGQPDAALLATLECSATHAARLVGDTLPGAPRHTFTVHNFNFPFPCTPAATVRRAAPAQVMVPRLFAPAADDGTHRFIFAELYDVSPPGLTTDKATVAAGYIAHSILDYRALGAL